jgi:hypothetical protein
VAAATGCLAGGALLVCLGWMSRPALALTGPPPYFVAAGGADDAACTQADPCSLATAISETVEGDLVYLGAGCYTGTGKAVVTLTHSISLYGGWDGTIAAGPVRDPEQYVTWLDGEEARRVVFVENQRRTVLDGLRIVNGLTIDSQGGGVYGMYIDLTMRNCHVASNTAEDGGGLMIYWGDGMVLTGSHVYSNVATDGDGGGLYVYDSVSATFTANRIYENEASVGRGGGVYMTYADYARIENNEFYSNTSKWGGGGICVEGSEHVSMLGNGIHHNASDAYGGGVRANGCERLILLANHIYRNSAKMVGGGVSVAYGDGLLMGENVIISNTATGKTGLEGTGAGVHIMDCRPFTFSNNIVARNRAETHVGGLYVQDVGGDEHTAGTVVNNTIADNDRGPAGAGVYVIRDVILTLTNNIIASNTYGIQAYQNSTVTADYTLFYSNTAGDVYTSTSVITSTDEITGSPPGFVDVGGWDYHLGNDSPAINAGDPAGSPPAPATDIDGDHRVGAPDVGADEHVVYVDLPVVLRSWIG